MESLKKLQMKKKKRQVVCSILLVTIRSLVKEEIPRQSPTVIRSASGAHKN
jgi:hypothetical protein